MSKSEKPFSCMRFDGKSRPKLSKLSAEAGDGIDGKKAARKALQAITDEMSELQYRLYAEGKTGLLVVFQAMDTGGKDGVIRRVFGPLNLQGVQVASFKQPSILEKSHDYLWRVHHVVPAKGAVRIFNRSHYEDVLVYRVHKLLPKDILEQRYRQINDFERMLTENDTVILKFFLHISKEEQRDRLESRLETPDKLWKLSQSDLQERKFWDEYMEAYEMMVTRCSTTYAPWYIIPSDRKWYRDWAVASIILDTLRRIDPQFPKPEEGLDELQLD